MCSLDAPAMGNAFGPFYKQPEPALWPTILPHSIRLKYWGKNIVNDPQQFYMYLGRHQIKWIIPSCVPGSIKARQLGLQYLGG